VAARYYEAMVRYGESTLVTDRQGRHHQGRCSGSAGAEGEVGGVALVAQRGRDAGVGGVAGFVVVGEGPGGGGADRRQVGDRAGDDLPRLACLPRA